MIKTKCKQTSREFKVAATDWEARSVPFQQYNPVDPLCCYRECHGFGKIRKIKRTEPDSSQCHPVKGRGVNADPNKGNSTSGKALSCEGGRALAQVAQRGSGASILGDAQNPAEQGT